MYRWDVINHLLRGKEGYSHYLEIGVQDATCTFDKIKAYRKTSVDPFPRNRCDYVETSDQFFARGYNIDDPVAFTYYDLIFIDGLHQWEQTFRDIANAMHHLAGGGYVVVHDTLPTKERQTSREDNHKEWTGDVWKAVALLRMVHTAYHIITVDTDWGCTILTGNDGARQSTHGPVELTWENYVKYRNTLMNVISVEEFKASY